MRQTRRNDSSRPLFMIQGSNFLNMQKDILLQFYQNFRTKNILIVKSHNAKNCKRKGDPLCFLKTQLVAKYVMTCLFGDIKKYTNKNQRPFSLVQFCKCTKNFLAVAGTRIPTAGFPLNRLTSLHTRTLWSDEKKPSHCSSRALFL